MSTSSPLRRGAATVGAAGLIALLLAGPAAARPDPGTGGSHERPQGSSAVTGPDEQVTAQVLRVDDGAWEYLQIGTGLAAGLALGGTGMLLVSRRHGPAVRGHPGVS